VSAAFNPDNCFSSRFFSVFNCFTIPDKFAIESPSRSSSVAWKAKRIIDCLKPPGTGESTAAAQCENANPVCHNLLMCGRYRLSRSKQIVEEHFDTVSSEQEWSSRYNIAPTQPVPVIRQNPKQPIRELSLVHWGLIPSWAKDSSLAAKMINARSETASTKPAFRDAVKFRRCLIPADGFYEWSRTGKAKQPYCFEVAGELFAFAGIWDRWKEPSGNMVETCSILTTTPNAVTLSVHDRMPVILDPDSYDLWLDPGMTDVVEVSNLLKPFDAGLMRSYPVSTRINHVANDDAECSRQVEIAGCSTNPLPGDPLPPKCSVIETPGEVMRPLQLYLEA
jgi:putative SOS response-associated peptidase YedK